MAYRNFSPTAEALDATGFSDLEWSVVEIARQDPLSSIAAPGRFARTIAVLLGTHPAPALANARLEALRRFVVASQHLGDRLPDQEIAFFVSAGFTQSHVRLLRAGAHPIPPLADGTHR